MKNAAATKTTTLNDASKNIVMHHLGSFQDNDLEAVIADYTNESVLITQDAAYKGPEEIKSFFATLMPHFPKQQSSFELDKVVVDNELVYIVWHANTPSLDVALGTDTFIIRDDKIYRQTFAGQMKFIK
jgi:ketosteroid isomerase-like protein